MKNILIALFFVVFVPSFSYANDTSGYVLPTGGVVFEKQDGLKMQVEALYIRPKQIEVNYLFENTTDKDITTQMFFPLPQMPAVEEYLGDEAQDYKFKLWVNGKTKPYQTHWTVTQNDKDITNDVSILFYRPEEVITDQQLAKRIQTLPEKQRIVFNLKYFKEMKYEEMSEILGTTIGSLKASYHHAVKKIEAFLAKHL